MSMVCPSQAQVFSSLPVNSFEYGRIHCQALVSNTDHKTYEK